MPGGDGTGPQGEGPDTGKGMGKCGGGKGRGKGFDYEDTSILGDDEISPIVANRCLQCVKMFIDSARARNGIFKQ